MTTQIDMTNVITDVTVTEVTHHAPVKHTRHALIVTICDAAGNEVEWMQRSGFVSETDAFEATQDYRVGGMWVPDQTAWENLGRVLDHSADLLDDEDECEVDAERRALDQAWNASF